MSRGNRPMSYVTTRPVPLTRKVSRDPYNKIGDAVHRELQTARVTYGYACKWPVSAGGVS